MPIVAEIITHFIGLFRVGLDPDRAWHFVDGAGRDQIQAIDPAGMGAQPAHHGEPVGSAPVDPTVIAYSDIREEAAHFRTHAPIHPQFLKMPIKHLDWQPTPQQPPPEMASPSVGWGGPANLESIPVNQVVADDQQVNALIADTSYVDQNGASASLPIPAGAQLDHLEALADHLIAPYGPELGPPASDELAIVKAYDLSMASASTGSPTSLATGSFVDGVQTSQDGSPAQVSLPVTQIDMSIPTAQDVQLGKAIVTGENVLGNAAVIEDTGSAPLSLIVEGNAHQTDMVIQTNVVENIDTIVTNNIAAVSSGADVVHNVAHFEQLPDVISTTVSGSLGQTWNVQVVNGDYYDVSTITQTNYLVNNTLYVGTPSTDHYYATLGSNTQLNALTITNDAPSFDLVVVLGNSYSASLIYQSNVLLNNAQVGVAFASGNNGADTVSTGQNTVTNEASIAEYGATQWSHAPSMVQSVLQALANGGAMSALFPAASLTGNVNVLVVTGDYYQLDLISQTNVVSNSANVLADMTTAGAGVPATVTTGQDILANSAAIVSAGALNSESVAGTAYQTAMLVQSNIITTQTAVNAGGSAFIAELTNYLSPDHLHDVAVLTLAASASTPQHNDVLAGVLH